MFAFGFAGKKPARPPPTIGWLLFSGGGGNLFGILNSTIPLQRLPAEGDGWMDDEVNKPPAIIPVKPANQFDGDCDCDCDCDCHDTVQFCLSVYSRLSLSLALGLAAQRIHHRVRPVRGSTRKGVGLSFVEFSLKDRNERSAASRSSISPLPLPGHSGVSVGGGAKGGGAPFEIEAILLAAARARTEPFGH